MPTGTATRTWPVCSRAAREILRLLVQQRCHKVLNDNTRVTSMWSEAAEWAGKEWFPAMTAAGLHYFAWVYSPNLYSRLSTDLTLQFTGGNPWWPPSTILTPPAPGWRRCRGYAGPEPICCIFV